MPFSLGDIYIGNFEITQSFGARPDIYSARFGIRGHNGIDIGCPSLTQVLSAADGVILETGFDSGGYGNYIKVLHDGYLTLYGHLNDLAIVKDEHVLAGQLIAHSNNTGLSDGPHLHFGVAPCDAQGKKTEPGNGYSGYIDPLSSLCEWHIKNLTVPVMPHTQTEAPVSISPSEKSITSVQANNFQSIVNFGMQNGLGVYLTNTGLAIDLINNPEDTSAGEKVNKWISSLLTENRTLKDGPLSPLTEQVLSSLPTEQKMSILNTLLQKVKGFVFA